eukprot:scaffold5807_cov412-Prasinococcus_capsulatus_cf.AAC.2
MVIEHLSRSLGRTARRRASRSTAVDRTCVGDDAQAPPAVRVHAASRAQLVRSQGGEHRLQTGRECLCRSRSLLWCTAWLRPWSRVGPVDCKQTRRDLPAPGAANTFHASRSTIAFAAAAADLPPRPRP